MEESISSHAPDSLPRFAWSLAGDAQPVRQPIAMTPLKLSRSQQLYVFITVLVVLPLVVGFAYQQELYALYLIHLCGPELQREFGFTAGDVKVMNEGGEPREEFGITAVVPGGLLARAGFKAGDIPTGYKHGFANGFYQDLVWVRKGQPMVITVVASEDYLKGSAAWREISLQPGAGH